MTPIFEENDRVIRFPSTIWRTPVRRSRQIKTPTGTIGRVFVWLGAFVVY